MVNPSRSVRAAGVALMVFLIFGGLLATASAATQAHSRVTHPSAEVFRPVFSVDGTKLAFADNDGWIGVLDLESGVELPKLWRGDAPVTALAFTPDGQIRRVAL